MIWDTSFRTVNKCIILRNTVNSLGGGEILMERYYVTNININMCMSLENLSEKNSSPQLKYSCVTF